MEHHPASHTNSQSVSWGYTGGRRGKLCEDCAALVAPRPEHREDPRVHGQRRQHLPWGVAACHPWPHLGQYFHLNILSAQIFQTARAFEWLRRTPARRVRGPAQSAPTASSPSPINSPALRSRRGGGAAQTPCSIHAPPSRTKRGLSSLFSPAQHLHRVTRSAEGGARSQHIIYAKWGGA